ncbi:MAG TPA: hypothetical protein VJY85_08520 [Candidatus Limnocylindria bacterium]|nr:hypothetical protein [Candidatus Limnocylindria bacterium]
MRRPIDGVTGAVLELQIAQREVTDYVAEVIERVSADPFGASSHPDLRLRLSVLRVQVDKAAAELIDALARLGEELEPE